MSEQRIIIETPCEHGSMDPHPTMEGIKSDSIELAAGGRGILAGYPKGMSYKSDCPGGSRRVFTPNDSFEAFLAAALRERIEDAD